MIPLIIGMAVIVFMLKSGDPFGEKEMPAVYLAMYVVLLFTGSGRYSIDRIKFQ
ncbi:MAG: hypothetical protein IPG69_00400 [Flavobacteriales bacterium]|nr:hypothetical protein [Flavobacteriales bacterium]